MGLFGNMFDFNGDGVTDAFEEAMGLGMLAELEEAEKNEEARAGLEQRLSASGVEVHISYSDTDCMTREELEQRLADLQEKLDDLEANEPDDVMSDAYDRWEDACQDLEEKIEEIEDLLDEME